MGGDTVPTVLEYNRDVRPGDRRLEDIVHRGFGGIRCVEAGGPQPGVGCAGRGILSTFETLAELGIGGIDIDHTIYDVLGDVVCGGFAVPLRREYADAVLIVTSGEFMSLYAANNILRGVLSYDGASSRIAGVVFNSRGAEDEERMVRAFADAVSLPIIARLPRSHLIALSEAGGRTVVEAFPGSEEATIFNRLAAMVDGLSSGSGKLYPALPLADDALERAVLSRSPSPRAQRSISPEPSRTIERSSTRPSHRRAGPDRIVHGCAFAGAVSSTMQLRDSVTIVHGPLSCTNMVRHYLSYRTVRHDGARRPSQANMISTRMDSGSMVFGGTGELDQAIRTAASQGYDLLFIVTTCPSGLMGEDVNGVAERVQGGTRPVRVVVVPADGNMMGDFSKGIVGAGLAAASLIDGSVEPEEDTVNIVGEKNLATNRDRGHAAMMGILDQLGVKVNCRYLSDTTWSEVKGFRKGGICLVANDDPSTMAIMDALATRTGAAAFPTPFPRGLTESIIWTGRLGELFDREREAERLIRAKQLEYETAISEHLPHLVGKKVLIASVDDRVGWIVQLADDLGMEVVKAGVGPSPTVSGGGAACDIQYDYRWPDLEADVARLRPDLVLCHPAFSADLRGMRYAYIPYTPDVGFEAGLPLARRWSNLVRLPPSQGWRVLQEGQ